jgi:hypothetical protein
VRKALAFLRGVLGFQTRGNLIPEIQIIRVQKTNENHSKIPFCKEGAENMGLIIRSFSDANLEEYF